MTIPPPQTGVRVRGLRKSFRGFRTRHEVLRGIDLDLAPGEVVGLIGPNGAGKTTLMSCLLGFLHPDAGEITFDGAANDDLGVRRRTGFVPERMNFDHRATGWAFLRYMARLAGVPPGRTAGRVTAMLERLGIAHAAGRRLSHYSRGMLQRIGMCQALIHEPSYLFFDEPTSGLDPNGVLLVRDLISEQKARGAAVLLNSHQLSEVEKVCDRVLFLNDGVIARAETLRHLDRIVVAITLLGDSFDAAAVERIAGAPPRGNLIIATVETEGEIAEVVRELVESGAGVIEVRRHTADLEGIFRGAA
ncbi:MAG TPA: ABC transporter ATP-binding protein [Thermoanaerobaculia bacterium]|nr:ABC transporter ATP-binding protein [Thermoanaerobaculia bacterium]